MKPGFLRLRLVTFPTSRLAYSMCCCGCSLPFFVQVSVQNEWFLICQTTNHLMIPQSVLKLNHLDIYNIKPSLSWLGLMFEAFLSFWVRLLLVIKSGLSLGASARWLTNCFKGTESLESKQKWLHTPKEIETIAPTHMMGENCVIMSLYECLTLIRV